MSDYKAVTASQLSIVVIHHRTPDLLQGCLARLGRFAPEADVLVVDTGPESESAALVESFQGVRFLNTRNHSLAHAVNVGLKDWLETSRPFVAHLNADVMVEADTLSALLGVLELSEVGMVGPRVVTPGGAWQNQGFPYRRHYRRLARAAASARTSSIDPPSANAPSVDVPWLSGCLQMTRRDVVARVGGMNSTLRFYNEDMEWCWRVRAAGLRVPVGRNDGAPHRRRIHPQHDTFFGRGLPRRLPALGAVQAAPLPRAPPRGCARRGGVEGRVFGGALATRGVRAGAGTF